jgi:hypothetical protein
MLAALRRVDSDLKEAMSLWGATAAEPEFVAKEIGAEGGEPWCAPFLVYGY